MLYLTPHPWYIEPLIHDILTPYPRYFDPSIHGILTSQPWYIDPLLMIVWPHYPWYFETSTHGILTPFPYFDPFPWYFDPPTHGNRTPYPWYFNPPIHVILIPLAISWLSMKGSKYHGSSIYHTGRSVFNKRAQYTTGVNIPYISSNFIKEHIHFAYINFIISKE